MSEQSELSDLTPPETRLLTKSPWIRLTYLFTDKMTDKLGHGVVVLSCVKCGDAKLYRYKAPLPLKQAIEVYGEIGDSEARRIRDAYEVRHLHKPEIPKFG